MKLKLLVLAALGTAGVGASYALAASTKGPHGEAKPPCRSIHIHGTMASPSTFVITVQKAGPKDVVKTGQVVTLTVGGTGQTVVADAESCTTGTGTSATLTTRHVNVHVSPPPPVHRGTTTTTTTNP